MSGRTYLSIGDVLTLLREEFPDVTISKIRFLESQGLVNPERSPSGYRKFFEPDVERLRWVLRQQREHFLPLKVIRDRLAAGDLSDLDEPASGEVAHTPSEATHSLGVPQPAGVGAAASGARAPSHTTSGAGVSRTEAQLAQADNEAMARIVADATRRAARLPDPANDRAPLHVVGDASRRSEHVEPAPGAPRHASNHPAAAATPSKTTPPRSAAPSANEDTPVVPSASARATARVDEGSTKPAERAPGAAPASPGRGAAKATPVARSAPKEAMADMVTGAAMTAEELCAASGLTEAELEGLLGFGLIEAMSVGGMSTFDEDALTVANVAAQFRKFGIEPRHLRMYRNAVDREMGLIEQVIIPLLRQRNPESRQRALDAADELGALGQTMRASLLRSALRRHVGG